MSTNDPMKTVLKAMKLEIQLFPVTSRYYGIETTTMESNEGKTIVYLKRRLLPCPDKFELIQEHMVSEGDRPDNLAAHYLGDPEQFWRLADANNVMRPEELTQEIGRRLRITQPEGLTGVQNA